MKREFLIFGVILTISLFMTIHNKNQEDIYKRNLQSEQYKLDQHNNLINDGILIKLSNGVVLRKSNDLIIIEQSNQAIIVNKEDADEIIAFLEN